MQMRHLEPGELLRKERREGRAGQDRKEGKVEGRGEGRKREGGGREEKAARESFYIKGTKLTSLPHPPPPCLEPPEGCSRDILDVQTGSLGLKLGSTSL